MILRATKTVGARFFDILVGAALLYVCNELLDPAPLGAALAWSLGLLCFWLRGSRSLWYAMAGVLAGVLLGAGWHAFAHHSGRSPALIEGQAVHLLVDAAVGVLIGGLAVAASLGRHLSRQRSSG